MPHLAGGVKKKDRAHNPALEAVALVVNPGDPPDMGKRKKPGRKQKRKENMPRKKRKTKRKAKRKSSSGSRRRRRNPARKTRRASSRKRRSPARRKARRASSRKRRRNPSTRKARTINRSRRRNYGRKMKRRARRRNPIGVGGLSFRNITKLLPAIGWTALGWSLSGIIMTMLGRERMLGIAKWKYVGGNEGRARAVVSGLTWIGLWFAIDKVEYLKKKDRKSNLLRGAGLRFAWEVINGWVPTTGYGGKLRTIFGLHSVVTGASTTTTAPRTPVQGQSYIDPMTGRPSGAVAAGYGYDDMYGGGMMDAGYSYGDDMYGGAYGGGPLGFHYENWQAAQPRGLALMPAAGSPVYANPLGVHQNLGFHYENWQAAQPTGLALQPAAGLQATANPLGGGNTFRPAFRPAF